MVAVYTGVGTLGFDAEGIIKQQLKTLLVFACRKLKSIGFRGQIGSSTGFGIKQGNKIQGVDFGGGNGICSFGLCTYAYRHFPGFWFHRVYSQGIASKAVYLS